MADVLGNMAFFFLKAFQTRCGALGGPGPRGLPGGWGGRGCGADWAFDGPIVVSVSRLVSGQPPGGGDWFGLVRFGRHMARGPTVSRCLKA